MRRSTVSEQISQVEPLWVRMSCKPLLHASGKAQWECLERDELLFSSALSLRDALCVMSVNSTRMWRRTSAGLDYKHNGWLFCLASMSKTASHKLTGVMLGRTAAETCFASCVAYALELRGSVQLAILLVIYVRFVSIRAVFHVWATRHKTFSVCIEGSAMSRFCDLLFSCQSALARTRSVRSLSYFVIGGTRWTFGPRSAQQSLGPN